MILWNNLEDKMFGNLLVELTDNRSSRLCGSASYVNAGAETAVAIYIRGRDGDQRNIRTDDLTIKQLGDFR